MNLRKVMYIVIVIVCIWSIAVGVYEQVDGKVNKRKDSENTVVAQPTKAKENDRPSQDDLKKEFDQIFTNKIMVGQYDTSSIAKTDEEQEIVYTYSAQRKTDNYELNINFPIINIENDVAKEINKESREIFINKANDIIQNANEQTFYTISYASYINNDILSIIIKSTLKEGNNAQRLMVQTYNINLTTGKSASLNDLLEVRQVDKETVSNEINLCVTEAIKEASVIQETGYEVYTRNTKDSMYSFNELDTFFLDQNGALCIVFAYGNYGFTSELDIVKI